MDAWNGAYIRPQKKCLPLPSLWTLYVDSVYLLESPVSKCATEITKALLLLAIWRSLIQHNPTDWLNCGCICLRGEQQLNKFGKGARV